MNYGIKETDCGVEHIECPLEASHEIAKQIGYVKSLADNLSMVGIGCSSELHYLADVISSLAKDISDGIYKESAERYQHSRESTNNLIGAALTACLLEKDQSHD